MQTHGNQALDTWAVQNPDKAKNINDMLNVAMGVVGGEGEGAVKAPSVQDAFKGAASDIKTGVQKTVQTAKNALPTPKAELQPPEGSVAHKAMQDAQDAKANAVAHDAIDKEVRDTAAKYPKVNNVLNHAETVRGTDPIRVLSSYANGEALPSLSKNGKLLVDKPVKFLTQQTKTLGKLKSELVATGKKTVSYKDFIREANKRINAQSWSKRKKTAQKADMLRAVKDFKKEYPKGIPNDEMDLIKSEDTGESQSYRAKIGLSPFQPDTHAIIGQVARKFVENTSGAAPVEELNQLLSSHYDAIKLLNSMRGYTPHGGVMSKMLRTGTAEIVGAIVGTSVGHPIAGALAGKIANEGYTHILNNGFITNPVKRALIHSMKGASPEVVQKALDYLDSKGITPKTNPTPIEGQSTQESSKSLSSPQPTTPKKSVKPPKGKAGGPNTLTSDLKSKTLGGRIKQAFQEYLKNPKIGLSTEDVTGGGKNYNVGLTSVKGSISSATDHLVEEGQALYEKGDFKGAQEKYNEALQGGVKTVNDAFNNTGIKVKVKGVGLGIYNDSLEPNYDMTANVPRGKEDLFHYILADVADHNFHQYSALTYKQVAHDTPFGVTDAKRGMSNEPAFRLTLEKPLTAEDVAAIQTTAKKLDIPALSVKEGGKSIDIVNITSYNSEYDQFAQKSTAFEQALNEQGYMGKGEHTTQEIRFVGSDPSKGHGAVSYDDFRNHFHTENPGFFNPEEGFQSRILDKLKYRQHVTPQEIEQITKSQDITPHERGVALR